MARVDSDEVATRGGACVVDAFQSLGCIQKGAGSGGAVFAMGNSTVFDNCSLSGNVAVRAHTWKHVYLGV